MTEPHKVHCYARIDRPYEAVRSVLHGLHVEGATAAPGCVHSIRDVHSLLENVVEHIRHELERVPALPRDAALVQRVAGSCL